MANDIKAHNLHENILIIYNPNAGKRNGAKIAKKLRDRLFDYHGIHVYNIFASDSMASMRAFLQDNKDNKENYTLIVIIGGDGTVGPIVDSMIKSNIRVPIYAMGRGTANDFASFFKTNKSIKQVAENIAKSNIKEIDTIKVDMPNNELDVHYAVSDAAGGAFTNGVTKYSKGSKRIFGKLAYIFTAGIKSLTLKSQNVKFTIQNAVERTFNKTSLREPETLIIEENIFLFYILNTKNVGGQKNAGYYADPTDGLLDLVIVKKCGFFGKVALGFNLLFGRLHKSRNVIYITGANFDVEILDPNPPIHNFTKTDTDGNIGGDYPLNVTLGPKITILTPK